MKKAGLFAICVLSVISFSSIKLHAQGPYEDIAIELSDSAAELKSPKIAVVPFSTSGKPEDTESGTIVSERLTSKLVKLKKFKVIDRESLQKVLAEQKLQTSGVVDPETAKKLGKVLGVEAIITGTITNLPGGMAEINAKLIRTETAEIINVSSAKVPRDWVVNQAAQQQPQQEELAYEQPAEQPKAPVKRIKMDVYTDLFYGVSGSNQADITFQNSRYRIKETDLLLDLDGNGTLNSNVTVSKITINAGDMANVQSPIGLRICGFQENSYFGGSFDLMYYGTQLEKQKTTATYNNRTVPFSFFVDDYFKVTTFLMDLDILLRYPGKKIQPYIGAGFGISFNTVSSPYIYGYDSGVWTKGFSEFAVGLAFNIPIGVRIMLTDDFGAWLESRTIVNTVNFTREIASETDSVKLSSNVVLLGVCFKSK